MTIVIDASAIVAFVAGEPEAAEIAKILSQADEIWATPMNLAEAGLILILRDGRLKADEYQAWLKFQRIRESPEVNYAAVIAAYLRYGKGVHRAGLNIGDCFAYALAKSLDAPLLFKGDDFARTDIRPALQPT